MYVRRQLSALPARTSRKAQTILVRSLIFWALERLEPGLSVLPNGFWDGHNHFFALTTDPNVINQCCIFRIASTEQQFLYRTTDTP